MIGKCKISLQMLALAGILLSTTAGAQIHNAAKIDSIVGLTGPLTAPLPPNKNFSFRVQVRYSLESLDDAVLHVDVEEFQGPAAGCTGSIHMTNGGSRVPIQRGQGSKTLDVTWNGSHPVYGAKSQFVGLFVTFSDPKTNKVIFTTFPPSQNQCFASGFAL